MTIITLELPEALVARADGAARAMALLSIRSGKRLLADADAA
ncbi:hypothetical protein ABC977_12250 [Thioalkalicoccus limnaeus]|uniref:Uncharacterized protein n=1 Tax=Thioalkalicoccus limnaeus TaxID=120681 RepID=A0ABV4BGS0_9GAMM